MNRELFTKMVILMTLINVAMGACISCGRGPGVQDAELKPYIQEFGEIYHIDMTTISATLVSGRIKNQDDQVVGLCEMGQGRTYFRREYWEILNGIEKKMLVFHELGHCAMNRDHRNDMYPDGCPKSIMFSYLFSLQCFVEHQDELLVELGSVRD